ncbi:MAG TPA: hypothetical protein VHU40_00175 [Polyangia bacterium]|jgi:hypothetical protein|nr:hypothetical protein [Polyangia bacterium]
MSREDGSETETRANKDLGPPAFEVLQALPGFCQLTKRSPTLDGNMPLRAAQHCSPVFEGNEAGFQISLAQPMTLRRDRRGMHIDMTPPAFEQTQREVRGALERLVDRGLLERDGYWRRLLARDALPIRGDHILLWTGFLVRPAAGVALRVGAAFNRRSRVAVVEHAITDSTRFTPLVLTIDGRDLPKDPLWIEHEIGCVLPTAARAELSLGPLRRAPEIVRAYEAYFDAAYFATKQVKPTGKYRRMIRLDTQSPSETCHAQAFYAAATASTHTLTRLQRFHHPAGIARAAPSGVHLPMVTVRNVARWSVDWNGQSFTREQNDLPRVIPSLIRDWKAAGGDPTSPAFQSLERFAFGPYIDEPYWILHPWVFARTPPGWSMVCDGANIEGADGMRGIVRTDQLNLVATVLRMYAPGRFTLRKGRPLLHFYPLPRRLQYAPMPAIATLS